MIAAALCCSSCAALFQSRLQSEYSGQSEPVCSTSGALAVLDVIGAAVDFLGAGLAASSDTTDPATGLKTDTTPFIAGAVIEGAVYLGSSIAGFGWAGDCRAARTKWNARSEIEPPIATEARQPDIAGPMPHAKIVEKLWFCTTPTTASGIGICARTMEKCEKLRAISTTPIVVMTDCTGAVAASCFSYVITSSQTDVQRCAPSGEACIEQRDAVVGDVDVESVGKCADTE